MGRPKKSAQASRTNGAKAKNKGLAVNVNMELFGGFSDDGTYVIKPTPVRREMAKGEVRRRVSGCERDVFTYCLYHGTFLRFDEGSAPKKKMKWASGVDPVRWEAAEERALVMLEQCKDLSPQQKIAKLRKRMKGSSAKVKFGRSGR